MTVVRHRVRRSATEPPEQLKRFGGGALALFGEMLVVSLVVMALALTGVLAVPAFAAGVDHLRRSAANKSDSLATLFRGIREALRQGWLLTVIYAVAVGLLCANTVLGARGFVPGGVAYAVLSGIVALVLAVLVCRAAGLWRPGAAWAQLLRDARTVAVTDVVGTGYVLAGMLVGAAVIWMLPPLIVIVPGMLAYAVMAAETRREQCQRRATDGPSGTSETSSKTR